jgi:xylan 1,4-beta-xylosidase
MGVYTERKDGTPVFNFQYVDALYDALLAEHIRPFVELSFMPRALASDPSKTVFWWKANVSPPKDPAKWQALIQALVSHFRERYGADEIARWYFEIWNEPDLSAFWSGTQQQYLDLYRETAQAVRAECLTCRVGGPASAGPQLIPVWLDYVHAQHLPADFLSSHTYAVTRGAFDADGDAGTVLDVRPSAIVDRVRQSRASAGLALPVHFTEWSTSYTPTDPIHDQYISAPFILEKLHALAGVADSMSYWTFTDIFEENGPRATPFHGGFGLMNYQGIRKPAYFAYQFLARLGPEDLATSDPQSWITRDAHGNVQALVWNYTPIAPPAGQTDQTFYRKEQAARPIADVQLSFRGLTPGRYRVERTRVGYKQNDAYTAYLHQGAPDQLSRAQVAELQTAASGRPESSRSVNLGSTGYRERLPMLENSAVLVTLTRVGK